MSDDAYEMTLYEPPDSKPLERDDEDDLERKA